jgi:hypothetical protein
MSYITFSLHITFHSQYTCYTSLTVHPSYSTRKYTWKKSCNTSLPLYLTLVYLQVYLSHRILRIYVIYSVHLTHSSHITHYTLHITHKINATHLPQFTCHISYQYTGNTSLPVHISSHYTCQIPVPVYLVHITPSMTVIYHASIHDICHIQYTCPVSLLVNMSYVPHSIPVTYHSKYTYHV